MSKQIFKKIIDINFFYEFLSKICEITNTEFSSFYTFNIESYKKMIYYNYQTDFLKELSQYYYSSKLFYLERELTYNSIATILRQICKFSDIKIMSKMKFI